MYVPPYRALMRALKPGEQGEVTIPASLLRLLLQIALAQADFDEEGYLKANPDVSSAVERGEIESGLTHYLGFGYFEGRSGGMARVDEGYYLKKYPDVQDGIRARTVTSAEQHFNLVGAGEGRSPNAEEEDTASQWKKALRG